MKGVVFPDCWFLRYEVASIFGLLGKWQARDAKPSQWVYVCYVPDAKNFESEQEAADFAKRHGLTGVPYRFPQPQDFVEI